MPLIIYLAVAAIVAALVGYVKRDFLVLHYDANGAYVVATVIGLAWLPILCGCLILAPAWIGTDRNAKRVCT